MKVKSWRSSGTSGLCVTPFINFTCPQRWRLFPVKQVHPMKCLNFHTTEHVQCAARIKLHLWIYSFFILKQEKENKQIVPTVKNCRNSSKDFTLRRHLNVKRGLLVYISVWEKKFQNVVIGPWLNSPTPFLFQKKKKQLYTNRVMKKGFIQNHLTVIWRNNFNYLWDYINLEVFIFIWDHFYNSVCVHIFTPINLHIRFNIHRRIVFASVQVLLNSPYFGLNKPKHEQGLVYRYPMEFLPHTFYYS